MELCLFVDFLDKLFCASCACTGNVAGCFQAAAYHDGCSSDAEQVFSQQEYHRLGRRRSAVRQTPPPFCFSFALKHTRGEERNPDPSHVRSAGKRRHIGGALFAERAAQINYVNTSPARVMKCPLAVYSSRRTDAAVFL